MKFTLVYTHMSQPHLLALTTGASTEDWRQVEELFDRIRNCSESGGHTESDAQHIDIQLDGQEGMGLIKSLSVEGSCM